jgi:hypothetical protein
MPSLDYTSPAGTVIPTQRSPVLGELIVMVGLVSGWEEDHAIAVTKRYEL